METGKEDSGRNGWREPQPGKFSISSSHLPHHGCQQRPTVDDPQGKEKEERRTGRRTRLLRLQEKEEGTRRLSFCPDGRTGRFLEHERFSGIPLCLPNLPISLNAARHESLRLPKHRQQKTISTPHRLYRQSPPQSLMPSSANLPSL